MPHLRHFSYVSTAKTATLRVVITLCFFRTSGHTVIVMNYNGFKVSNNGIQNAGQISDDVVST